MEKYRKKKEKRVHIDSKVISNSERGAFKLLCLISFCFNIDQKE